MENRNCHHCKEPLPLYALHFSNEAAIAKGYCSYFCLSSALGEEKALKALQKHQQRTHESDSPERSPKSEYSGMDEKQFNRGNSANSGISDTLRLILSDDPEEVRDRAYVKTIKKTMEVNYGR